MGFVTIPGLPGKLYVPENDRLPAGKQPCADCFSCQNCGQDRCRLCCGCNGEPSDKPSTANKS